MRIVHVVYSMEMGGAESLVAQLCRLQRAHGHEVSVLAQAKLGTLGARLRDDGFAVEVAGTGNPLRTFPRWLRLFRRLRPEVVHCHNPAPTIQAAPAARLTGARVVVSTRHSLVAPPYDRKTEALYAVAAGFCDWVVGICEATCANLRGTPGARRGRIVRVYNGAAALPEVAAAELREVRAEASRAVGVSDAREMTGAGGSAVPTRPRTGLSGLDGLDEPSGLDGLTVFVFVGRLAAIKDLPTLLRAFSAARAEREGLRLWIVGDGPERRALEALATELGVAEAVHFWGEQHAVAAFFRAADVFCMSSTSEGLPMSLLQAMSAGLPALVTDVGGMAEVVRLAGGGLTAPVGDSIAYATAMLTLAGDPALRTRLGASARAAYTETFTLAEMDRAYMRLYRAGAPDFDETGRPPE